MKKYFCNIRTLAALLMTGAALAACSNTDDTIIEQEPVTPAGEQVYKLTIKTSNGNDATRALTLDAGNLVATWAVGDVLTVSKGSTTLTSDLVCTETEGDAATFSGTITGEVSAEDVLTLTYHPMAISAFGGQDGTLRGTAKSAEKYDMATATVTVASVDSDNNITISETSADFTTQTAVMKLTLTTNGENTINPNTLTVSAKLGAMSEDIFTITIPAATYSSEDGGNGILYFALPSASSVASRLAAKLSQSESLVSLMLSSADIIFTATVGSAIYTATKETGYIFAGGTYYNSTLTMERTPVDLSKLKSAYTAVDGDILTGTLDSKVEIRIAENAKVTLNNLTIIGDNDDNFNWAGIACEGDAEITLVGENTVKGFYDEWPGIYVPERSTLTIKGTGKLDASSNGYGAGIGACYYIACGNIDIQGGEITATGGEGAAGIGGADWQTCGDITISGGTIEAIGGDGAAGIGSGRDITDMENAPNITITGGTVKGTGGDGSAGIGSGNNSACGNIIISDECNVEANGGEYGPGIGGGAQGVCGNIEISGGTVEATGGDYAAGIGCGQATQVCGDIIITDDVISVTATKGSEALNCIGADYSTMQSGRVVIGVTQYWNGNEYVNEGEAYLQSSQIVYPEP